MKGRPRKIESPEQFDERAEAYFAECNEKKERPLLLGLVLALGIESKNTLYEYGKRDGFQDSVKRALSRIELEYEKSLHGGNAAGPIFALKNFGWTDKQTTEHTGKDGGPIENKWTVEIVSAEDTDTG